MTRPYEKRKNRIVWKIRQIRESDRENEIVKEELRVKRKRKHADIDNSSCLGEERKYFL